jgi:hypothetical protein
MSIPHLTTTPRPSSPVRAPRLAAAAAALLLPALASAAAESPSAARLAQFDCASPRNQALLTAPVQPDPRDNVWVLEVLEPMGLNGHCQELKEDLLANYLERQAANDVVKEDIGRPATIRDAIEWERKAEYENTPPDVAHDRTHIHSRLLSRGFALDAWTPAAADVPALRATPGFAMASPGVWMDATGSKVAQPPRLSLAFTNTSGRTIEWDAHTLYARRVPDGPYDLMFSCMRDGLDGPRFTVNRATVPAGGHVDVVCRSSNTDVPAGTFDAAWFARLQDDPQQWFVEGPPSDGGTYDYQKTILAFANARSHAAAGPYLHFSDCDQTQDCLLAKAAWYQSPIYLWTRDGLPGLLGGIALAALLGVGRRARMARVALPLVGAIVVLYVGTVAYFIRGGYGLGALAIAFSAGRVAVGAIAGVLAVRWWAARSGRS